MDNREIQYWLETYDDSGNHIATEGYETLDEALEDARIMRERRSNVWEIHINDGDSEEAIQRWQWMHGKSAWERTDNPRIHPAKPKGPEPAMIDEIREMRRTVERLLAVVEARLERLDQLAGLVIHTEERDERRAMCKRCNVPGVRGPAPKPHAAQEVCPECNKWIRWVPKSDM